MMNKEFLRGAHIFGSIPVSKGSWYIPYNVIEVTSQYPQTNHVPNSNLHLHHLYFIFSWQPLPSLINPLKSVFPSNLYNTRAGYVISSISSSSDNVAGTPDSDRYFLFEDDVWSPSTRCSVHAVDVFIPESNSDTGRGGYLMLDLGSVAICTIYVIEKS